VARHQETAAYPGVLGSRHGQAHGIDSFGCQSVSVGDHFRAKLRGDLFRASAVRICHSNKLGPFDLAPHANVVPAKFSNADDGNADQSIAQAFSLVSAFREDRPPPSGANA
jgi:hypothetical protein